MVVLQLGPYPPPHGGVQTNLVAIREHLRRQGMGAPVINLTRHRAPERDEVYYPRSAGEVVRLLRKIPADVIHLHIGGRLSGRLLALCLFCTLLPGRRTVLTFHSGGYPSWQKRRRMLPFWVRGLILPRLDAILAVNAEIASLFRTLGVHPSRIRLTCPFTPVAVSGDTVLPEPLAGFAQSHHPLLTTVGLLEPEYDLGAQIRMFADIRREFPQAGLVIVGSGSLDAELRRQIAAHPAAAHILLCGDVAHPVTLKVIAGSDAFLRTTLYDGDSISVREALQLGVPVVATDNGMRPDGVHLIPRSDSGALLATVRSVLRAPVHRSASSGRADESLDDLLDLYRSLVSPRSQRTAREPSTVL